jgi:hypothetical protein
LLLSCIKSCLFGSFFFVIKSDHEFKNFQCGLLNMQFTKNEVTPSPASQGCVRTGGQISWGQGQNFHLWIDVPAEYAESLSDTGNPWLLAMLPMAASLGEDIELSLPVDALLLENVKGILAIWQEWYPELHKVAIDCPVLPYEGEEKGKRTAAFFSGGVDSYFTIARRMPGNDFGIPAVGKVDDLLSVWGFDVGVNDEAEFHPLADMLRESASAMNLNHIIVRTNLRESIDVFKKQWGPLTFGVGLAFIGTMLEKRFKEVVLGSSYPYGGLMPWGSHPLVDPLFSTSTLRIMHDGASFTRIGKTEIMARLPVAEKSVHVCQAAGIKNCSQCEKCFRTMIALDILGKKDAFAGAFDWSGYGLSNIKKLYIGGGDAQIFYKEMISVAQDIGRSDIATALLSVSRRSSVLAPMVHFADWLARQPVVWKFGVALRTLVLSGSIGQRYTRHAAKACMPGQGNALLM